MIDIVQGLNEPLTMFFILFMKKTNKTLLFLFFLFLANTVLAKTVITSTIFHTDFEDTTDFENWELNVGVLGPECENKWYIGKPGANGGEYGMYISADSLTNKYESKPVSVVARRKIILDAGQYDLSFDWQGGGFRDFDGLYVCWIPEGDNMQTNSNTANTLQSFVKKYAIRVDEDADSIRLLQRTWNTIDFKITSDGTPHYLVFLWNNGPSSPLQPGACIDNIFIMESGRCSKPTQLLANVKGTDILLSWKGGADAYDVKVYCQQTKEWYYFDGIKDKFLEVEGLAEGMKTYYVRAICDSVFGSWSSADVFLYYQGNDCIDYLELSNKTCRWGNFSFPTSNSGVINYGYKSMKSRHTLHYDQEEYDARTQNKLKTVPLGALASVRLGNWDINAEGEGVVYTYYVDTAKSTILLLNYAIVMEDPLHGSGEQPMFKLNITENGKNLESNCGTAHFAAGFDMDDDSWHQFEAATVGGSTTIGGWWKDWTTVGINLAPYHGRTLKIEMTTYDCSLGGHFGYAYFTLGCSAGKIEGLSCGGDGGSQNGFKAPDGFKYRWYLPDNPENILSTEQYFMVGQQDTLTYYLDVIQPTNENCYFTLQASAVARFPRAATEYTSRVSNCENVVKFDNKSYIERINQLTHTVEKTVETCETFVWDFGDGTTSTEEHPDHVYGKKGGTYNVMLVAGVANGVCSDTISFPITLPSLEVVSDTTHAFICNGKGYQFPPSDKKSYKYTSGIYADTIRNQYGCDSVINVLDLTVHPRLECTIEDTLCSSEVYIFEGDTITESGKYVKKLKSVVTGCDSTITLYLNQISPLGVYISDELRYACADDEGLMIEYDVDETLRAPKYFSVTFDSLAQNEGFVGQSDIEFDEVNHSYHILLPKVCRPNRYTATFAFKDSTGVCGDVVVPVQFDVYYSDTIFASKFDNLLTLKNAEYNEGFHFDPDSCRWYRSDGEFLSKHVGAYLYLGEGEKFGDDCYYVELLRVDDGVRMRTCEICPGLITDIEDVQDAQQLLFVTKFNPNQQILFDNVIDAIVKIYSFTGLLVSEFVVDDNNVSVNAPCMSGFYLLHIQSDNYNIVSKIQVK